MYEIKDGIKKVLYETINQIGQRTDPVSGSEFHEMLKIKAGKEFPQGSGIDRIAYWILKDSGAIYYEPGIGSDKEDLSRVTLKKGLGLALIEGKRPEEFLDEFFDKAITEEYILTGQARLRKYQQDQ